MSRSSNGALDEHLVVLRYDVLKREDLAIIKVSLGTDA